MLLVSSRHKHKGLTRAHEPATCAQASGSLSRMLHVYLFWDVREVQKMPDHLYNLNSGIPAMTIAKQGQKFHMGQDSRCRVSEGLPVGGL